ncbi:MAG: hypothetical protein ACLQVD_00045 [Capsulimonadaceae bacterium]
MPPGILRAMTDHPAATPPDNLESPWSQVSLPEVAGEGVGETEIDTATPRPDSTPVGPPTVDEPSGAPVRRSVWLGIGLLALLTLLQFGDVLFAGHRVLSAEWTDTVSAEGPLRAFMAQWMRRGVLPLWNPHIFAGSPCFTSGEAPVFYPPTWLHLILPLDKAINAIVALHIFWLGAGMYLWAMQRGIRPVAAVAAALTVMFGGACFPHVYAGHIGNIQAMAWVPFLFLALDLILDGRRRAGCLVGAGSLAMEILACQPQYTYYAMIALVLYLPIRLLSRRDAGSRGALAVVAALAIGLGLGAVQLLGVLPEVAESTRGGAGLPYVVAKGFSFVPGNIVTLFAPWTFGDMSSFPYWGQSFLWESCAYMGVTGLALAIYALFLGGAWLRPNRDRRWECLAMVLLTFALAMGDHLPFYRVLFHTIPGYNRFRGTSKFIFESAVFGGLLAGQGLEALLTMAGGAGKPAERVASLHRAVSGGLSLLGLAAGAAALWLLDMSSQGPASPWAAVVNATLTSGPDHVAPAVSHPGFVAASAAFAGNQLLVSAIILLISGILFLGIRKPRAPWLVLLVLTVDLMAFAHRVRPTVDITELTLPAMTEFVREHPGDYRVYVSNLPNEGDVTQENDIWGYDSFKLKRYSELATCFEGMPPDDIVNDIFEPMQPPSSLFRLMGVRYLLLRYHDESRSYYQSGGLPHGLLVDRCVVRSGLDNVLGLVADTRFDPKRTVVLEQTPSPAPVSGDGAPGTVNIVSVNPNALRIDATLTRPAILLITDSYSRFWKARALPGSVQPSYTLLPGDWALRAIPLSAGTHHLMVEYDPPLLAAGAAISLASAAVYVWLALPYLRRRRVPS